MNQQITALGNGVLPRQAVLAADALQLVRVDDRGGARFGYTVSYSSMTSSKMRTVSRCFRISCANLSR